MNILEYKKIIKVHIAGLNILVQQHKSLDKYLYCMVING